MEADWPAQKRQPNNTILLLGGDSPLRHTTGAEISGIGLQRSFNKYYLSLISGIYLFLLYQLGSFWPLTQSLMEVFERKTFEMPAGKLENSQLDGTMF